MAPPVTARPCAPVASLMSRRGHRRRYSSSSSAVRSEWFCNASVGAYLHATGGLARFPGGRYVARQGAAVGRAGEVQVSVDAAAAGGPEIRIGGAAVTVIEGTIRLA